MDVKELTQRVHDAQAAVKVYHCRDCGEHHQTSGDAHACDHRLGRHRTPVEGCPLCARKAR